MMNMDHQHDNTLGFVGRGNLLEDWRHCDRSIERGDPMEMDSAGSDLSPVRCAPGPLNPQVADDLIEDWPHRGQSPSPSCGSFDSEDWQSLCKNLEQPRVTFSERSSMHIYNPDSAYVQSMSYSREDRKTFSTEALKEAMRIKKLVLSSPGSSPKDAFKHLLRENVISLEEIVGIEHLVLGRSASKLLQDRRAHAQAVLQEQRKQRHLERMAAIKEDPKNLGEFSASISIKSARRARIRAAMAA